MPGRWVESFCYATGCAEVRGESGPVALPKGSFPRQRQVVLEPLRRVGVDPAKHGSSQPQRQATPAVVEALGGPYQFWFVSRQLGSRRISVRNAPERAQEVQHGLRKTRGEAASPRAFARVRRRQWEEWVEKCTREGLRKDCGGPAIVLFKRSLRFEDYVKSGLV